MNRGHPVGSWVGAVPADSTHTRRERDEGGVMETSTIDRLYLELSQFTTATTARELAAERGRNAALQEQFLMERFIEEKGLAREWVAWKAANAGDKRYTSADA